MNSIIPAKSQNPGDSLLALLRQKYPDYHPIIAMVDIAHEERTEEMPELRYKCHMTVSKFIVPELKTMEVKAVIEERRRVTVSLFGEADIEDGLILTDTPEQGLISMAVAEEEGVPAFDEC